MLTPREEAAYWAGIIDGEGSISIFKRRSSYLLFLRISNADRMLVESFRDFAGCGSISRQRKRKDFWSQIYRCVLSPKATLNVLLKCFPFLRVKQKQAILAFSFNNAVGDCRGKGKKISSRELELREEFQRMMKKLNGRYRATHLK